MLKRVAKKFFPPTSKRGRQLKNIAARVNLAKPFLYDGDFMFWIDHKENDLFIEVQESKKSDKPLFSIVIPAHHTPQKYLDSLFESIVNQTYSDWEVIIGDDSTDEAYAEAIKNSCDIDERFHYHHDGAKGISDNTNAALSHATGKYIVFCDHDDLLSRHALNEFAAAVRDNNEPDIIYSDEDKINDDGSLRHSPHFKPDWSPHQFLTCNWMNHLTAIKSDLVRKTVGLRTEFNGAQDYDLLLRVQALPGVRTVSHVPKILYHWREAEGSTAGDFNEKSYAIVAGAAVLGEYAKSIAKKSQDVISEAIPNRPGFYKLTFLPLAERKIVIVVESHQGDAMTRTLKHRISDVTEGNKTKIFTQEEFLADEKDILGSLSDDDHIFYIQGLVQPASDQTDWIMNLSGALELDDIYAIAPRILDKKQRIADMGYVRLPNSQWYPLFKGLAHDAGSIFGHTEWIRDVDGLGNTMFGTKKKYWQNCWSAARQNNPIESTADGIYTVVWSNVTAVVDRQESHRATQFNRNVGVIDGNITVV